MGYTVVYFNALDFIDILIIFNINIDKALAQGFLTGCVPGMACVGSLLSRYILNKITRKQCLNVIIIFCVTSVLLVQTQNLFLLILGRMIQGCLVGVGTTVIPLYIK